MADASPLQSVRRVVRFQRAPGDGIPSALNLEAIARGLTPSAYSSKIRRTVAASTSSISTLLLRLSRAGTYPKARPPVDSRARARPSTPRLVRRPISLRYIEFMAPETEPSNSADSKQLSKYWVTTCTPRPDTP